MAEAIESGVRATREGIQIVTSSFSDQQAQLSGYIDHAKDKTQCKLHFNLKNILKYYLLPS